MSFFGNIISKEGGAAKYNTVPVPTAGTIIGGHDWHPDASTQRMVVVTSGGFALKDNGAGDFATVLRSGLDTTITPVFVSGGQETLAASKKLFMFSGTGSLLVLTGDGSSFVAVATPPADWTGANHRRGGRYHDL